MKRISQLAILVVMGTIMTPDLALAATKTYTQTVYCPSDRTTRTYSGTTAASSCPDFISTGLTVRISYASIGKGYCNQVRACDGTLKNQSPPPPPPPPATPSSAKTGLAPPKTRSTHYTAQTTKTNAIDDFNYESLPLCPHDAIGYPDNPDSRSATFTTTDYLDINDKPSFTGNKTLPDQCKVKSLVLCRVNGVNDRPCTPGSISEKITKSRAAVCPSGYVQVASFDMQPEVVNAPYTKIYPITSIDAYSKYNNTQGYSCYPSAQNIDGTYPEQNNTCAQASPYYGYHNNSSDPGWNPWGYQFGLNNIKMIYGTVNGTTGTYVGLLYNSTDFSKCYFASPADCSSPVAEFGSGCPVPNYWYTRKWIINKAFMLCERNAGIYYTANMAPRGLVCARIKPTYQKINK